MCLSPAVDKDEGACEPAAYGDAGAAVGCLRALGLHPRQQEVVARTDPARPGAVRRPGLLHARLRGRALHLHHLLMPAGAAARTTAELRRFGLTVGGAF